MTVLIAHYWICNWGPCHKKSKPLKTGSIWIGDYPTRVYPPEGWVEYQMSNVSWHDIVTDEIKHPCCHFCCQEHLDLWMQARKSIGLETL